MQGACITLDNLTLASAPNTCWLVQSPWSVEQNALHAEHFCFFLQDSHHFQMALKFLLHANAFSVFDAECEKGYLTAK